MVPSGHRSNQLIPCSTGLRERSTNRPRPEPRTPVPYRSPDRGPHPHDGRPGHALTPHGAPQSPETHAAQSSETVSVRAQSTRYTMTGRSCYSKYSCSSAVECVRQPTRAPMRSSHARPSSRPSSALGSRILALAGPSCEYRNSYFHSSVVARRSGDTTSRLTRSRLAREKTRDCNEWARLSLPLTPYTLT